MSSPRKQETYSGLPKEPETYEAEYGFWPWGMLLAFVADWVETNAPANATVLDYMCGTGYLLNELTKRRRDLQCFGCSLTPAYVDYAKRVYRGIRVDLCDALDYEPVRNPDVVVCTAGLHHLPPAAQSSFLRKVACQLDTGKIFVVGEELIRESNCERERRMSVIELDAAILSYMTEKEAPPEILVTAADVLKADLLRLEYKLDKPAIESLLRSCFRVEENMRLWPEKEVGYGDYVFICRRQ